MSEPHYFEYSDAELDDLKKKDKKLARAIDRIGRVHREVNPDLFQSLMHSIIGQQISTKAVQTIWARLLDLLPELTPEAVAACSLEQIQGLGMSYTKAQNMIDISRLIVSKQLDVDELHTLDDESLCQRLTQLKGIGVWTAEMLMLFCMQRPNILSYGDLAIQRGLRMLYRHKKITKALWAKYHKRYSPHASIASLYLWAIAAGALDDLSDPASPKVK